ncbi:MAG: NADH dehydrogenase (quinone) subunit D [bacterium]|nr:NADH dehydrogenase (quinone) subunit D [bacterium]MCY3579243.1 NADH dehydrogenase (quinone) subunit D [bacterium]MCY3652613.1 NADH dehydrogenase (quinone) subunit D [bacterium]MDE0643230.1 NADH dehydrogenase (quinone) subunit D [bacterium]
MAKTTTTDIWISGTEAPEPADWMVAGTDEGAQEMVRHETEERDREQRGSRVMDDWVVDDTIDDDERMIVNMGPQHPSTHGVLRLNIELEGEIVRRVKPIIGYLHTGMEKTAETLTFLQGGTNVTRMDYLAPLHNELCYSLAVEKLLGVEIPPRAQAIRVLLTELNRVSSHLVATATNGMDIGALSMMMYGFRERELILEFFEKTTGLRMNHNFIRPGGVAADLPDGWREDVDQIIVRITAALGDYEDLLKENPIWKGRTRGVGIITAEECLAYGITGPTLRATGVDWDLRKTQPYSGIEAYDFEVVTGSRGDVYDRYRVRIGEITQSLRIVEQVMHSMPKGDYKTGDRKVSPPPRQRINESMEALIHHFKIYTEGFQVPVGETYQAIEGPRGELGCYLVSDGSGTPQRMHTRAPSFSNLAALPIMMADSLVADTVACIASLDPVMGDVDR